MDTKIRKTCKYDDYLAYMHGHKNNFNAEKSCLRPPNNSYSYTWIQISRPEYSVSSPESRHNEVYIPQRSKEYSVHVGLGLPSSSTSWFMLDGWLHDAWFFFFGGGWPGEWVKSGCHQHIAGVMAGLSHFATSRLTTPDNSLNALAVGRENFRECAVVDNVDGIVGQQTVALSTKNHSLTASLIQEVDVSYLVTCRTRPITILTFQSIKQQ